MIIGARNVQSSLNYKRMTVEVGVHVSGESKYFTINHKELEDFRSDVQNLMERIDEAIAHNRANRGPNE